MVPFQLVLQLGGRALSTPDEIVCKGYFAVTARAAAMDKSVARKTGSAREMTKAGAEKTKVGTKKTWFVANQVFLEASGVSF